MEKNSVILIVDDQPYNIELLEAYLIPQGYKILTASNGEEALVTLAAHPVDLILLDVMMPDMDGFEVTRRVRLIDGFQQLPIILVTALRETEDRIMGIEAGCDDFISKPLDKHELVSRVRSLLKVKAYHDLKSNYEKELVLEVAKRTDELKYALEKLERKELFLSTLIESAPIPIFYKDKEGVYLGANRLFLSLFGFKRDEIIGKCVYDIAPKELADRYKAEEMEIFNNPTIHQVYESEVQNTETKERRNVIFHKNIFFDTDGNIAGLIGAIIDITEKKKMDEEYKKQEEMIIAQSRQAAMGEMISMIAHQWRQPITAIGMGANNMLMDIELDEIDTQAFKSHLILINDQVEFLSRTIDDFKDFFKSNQLPADLHISKTIASTLKIVGKSLENNNIAVELQMEFDPIITAHESELIQVLIVILNNAKDALVENHVTAAHIQITMKKSFDSSNFMDLSICDNGGGIPTEIIERIFEPYFTTKSSINGTGLGLYIAKTIIEKHHSGRISAKNKDEGACFILKLPIKNEVPQANDGKRGVKLCSFL